MRVPTIVNWPGKLKPAVVNEPLHMVDVMPTLLALAGGKGSPDHPFDGKDIWATLAEGKPSPHEDILINVEAFRGAIRKGNWKLVKIATLPGKTELFDLAEGSRRAEQRGRPASRTSCSDLEARLMAYAKQQKPSEWIKAQPQFLGARARPSSIPTSTSTTAACRTRSRPCPKSRTGGDGPTTSTIEKLRTH